jgi:hypothetical protein
MPLALAAGKWAASRPGRFAPGERAPGTHWIGGRVDPTDSNTSIYCSSDKVSIGYLL